MNLKKSDKIIAAVIVLILIVAAIAVVAYVATTEDEEEDTEMETMTYDVFWTKETGEMTITGEALPTYADSFTISAPSGSVLTSVDVNISWEDDIYKVGFLGLKLIKSRVKGLDTLMAEIGISGKSTQTFESVGEGSEILYFTVNSKPVDDFVEAEDEAEVEDTVDYMYGDKDSATFDVNVEVQRGKTIKDMLKDKGDDFTLTITYEYYTYDIVEPEPVEDEDDDEETSLTTSYMPDIKSSNMKYW